MENGTALNYTESSTASPSGDCLSAQKYVEDPSYQIVRWSFVVAGLAITLLLVGIGRTLAQKGPLPLHGNLKLLLLNVLFLYALFGWTYMVTSVRYLIIARAHKDPCDCLTPVWLGYLLRMPAYAYLIASPLMHFAIMAERVRATIFVRDYEREGLKYGLGSTLTAWSISAIFLVYIAFTSLQDTVTFSKPLVYLSMTNSYNAQVFINIHYFFLFLVVCVSFADYLLVKLNKIILQAQQHHSTHYNLSQSYQANENLVTMGVFFPLDLSYTFFFTVFIVVSAVVRINKSEMGLLAYNTAYEGIQLILSVHAIITLAAYLYFLKKNRQIAGQHMDSADQTKQYFRNLQFQWR